MTLDQYLRDLLADDSGRWFDMSCKVKLVDGRLIVMDAEVGEGEPPTGEPSARALAGGTRLFWQHKVVL